MVDLFADDKAKDLLKRYDELSASLIEENNELKKKNDKLTIQYSKVCKVNGTLIIIDVSLFACLVASTVVLVNK